MNLTTDGRFMMTDYGPPPIMNERFLFPPRIILR